jgi:hypothetical protein
LRTLSSESPKTRVFPALPGLDTLGIGLYKPPTFGQAVSFQRSIGASRVTIEKTQTLPLTASVRNFGCTIAARFAAVLCERVSALPRSKRTARSLFWRGFSAFRMAG